MKKSLIATGAASLALAAMPVVGVFATQDPAQVVDTVRVIIDESCTFEATQNGQTVTPTAGTPPTISRAFEKHATLGEVVFLAGTGNEGVNPASNAITVAATCNYDTSSTTSQAGTWSIKAASSVTMAGATAGNSIPNATTNAELTSGATSAWSMKISAPTTGVQNGYGSYHAMPSAEGVVVVTGNTSTSTDVTFTPEYRVYVGTDQAADTYTGTVTYTIASPAE